ncbi:hypothetical protein [Lactiplantibacillus daowaiensis]|uniref:Uncharacterized protein n=1 Tax=Lactiplantibacillus daowaiensis TaxID=2559918 RepID=A0ABW1RW64_9LACO|nr:hypothetical protein [Lactiplantibacillus daowaiensis]
MENVGSTTYWYKTKKIAKHPSITYHFSKFNGYYYDHYTPAYLQANADPQKLYTTPAGAIAKKRTVNHLQQYL